MKKKKKHRSAFDTTWWDYHWTRFWLRITKPWDEWKWKPIYLAMCKKKGIVRHTSGTFVATYGMPQSYKQRVADIEQIDQQLKETMSQLDIHLPPFS